ncbi:MAG: hypothetical protein IPG45_15480 [Deltaproteobacteria bacterium]|jgi:hypothetical protein|nr:hypothetical protein [Deltaproteobacteria bacterium]
MDAAREARAKARMARMVIHKGVLGSAEAELSPIRGEEAISLLTRLTAEGWSLSGRELPTYRRAEIPFRFIPGFGE